MKRLILSLFLIIGNSVVLCANTWDTWDIDSLLSRLEEVIEERSIYIVGKEQRLDNLKKKYALLSDDRERFELLGVLQEEYSSYNADSCLIVTQKRLEIARSLGDKKLLDFAHMNMAEVMGIAGMYKEAVEQMDLVDINTLPDYQRGYYYHILRTVYSWLTDYVVIPEKKERYRKEMITYGNLLVQFYAANKDSLSYALSMSQYYNQCGEYDKAIKQLQSYYKQIGKNDFRGIAFWAYTMSESYSLKGDKENEKKYLAIASIADFQAPVLEYAALPKLAVQLFREGDVERAYIYLKVCMEDAVACNARLRILNILQIFPIVNDVYQQQITSRQKQMMWALISISLLSFFLLLSVFYVRKQMKRVMIARRELMEANKRLKELNEELHNSNEKLKEATHNIAENSYLKEEYIGRYMDLCSTYIEKMDTYRRQLSKIASTSSKDELCKYIKSSKFIESELKEFYAEFDDTFLQLFPTFVEDFNSLLQPQERIYPKENERMNTELRIFALIRLGITDSVKIAHFLRYSVTTIYNYRTKVRNKAVGSRDELERMVAKIGKLNRYI